MLRKLAIQKREWEGICLIRFQVLLRSIILLLLVEKVIGKKSE